MVIWVDQLVFFQSTGFRNRFHFGAKCDLKCGCDSAPLLFETRTRYVFKFWFAYIVFNCFLIEIDFENIFLLTWHWMSSWISMMMPSNGTIFCVTGPLWGEFTGHRWIPITQASDAEFWYFLWSSPEKNSWVNNRDTGDLRRLSLNMKSGTSS